KVSQLQAGLAAAKQDVRILQADMEAAYQNVNKTKSELQYAVYQQNLSQGLAKKGAGPEEDAQKWTAQVEMTGAGVKQAAADADRSRLRYQSEINGVNTTVAKAVAELQESEAALQQALATVDGTKG